MVNLQHGPAAADPVRALTITRGGLAVWRERLVKRLILERLNEAIEVSELAHACALSRSHFSRAFRRSVGVSPQDWIRQQRIERAKKMILGASRSLTQISLDCGFSDQAHFCNSFLRSEGMTASRYQLLCSLNVAD